MAVRPTLGEDVSDIQRGTGRLAGRYDYLANIDPVTYQYHKLKDSGNRYFREDMWTEAAQRGETGALVTYLNNIQKLEDEQADFDFSEDYNKWAYYKDRNRGDYDSYMLTLSKPMLNTENKQERIDQETGYNFGSFTDREWADEVLNAMYKRYDAELFQEEKENRAWWQKIWQVPLAYAGSGASHLAAGMYDFLEDISNVGEGIFNCFINWSDDKSWGKRFMYAFQDDKGFFGNSADYFRAIAYKLNYNFTEAVDAVEAYENGYNGDISWKGTLFGGEWTEAQPTTEYKGFGKYYNGIIESMGYMLPSMLLTYGLGSMTGVPTTVAKAAGTAVFYTGIFGGNVEDNIQRALNNNDGLTYKDLNAGEVLSNAAVKATGQLIVELALGKLLGWFSALGEFRGTARVASKSARIAKTTGEAIGIQAGRFFSGMAKEGIEEVLQDMSDAFFDWAYSKAGSDELYNYSGQAKETMSFKNLLMSFVAGAAMEGMMGTLTNLQFGKSNNRQFMVDANGNAILLGPIRSMNMKESLATLNEWNDILNDPNASDKAKRNTAFKMSAAMNTIGDLFKNFGATDAYAVNKTLLSYANNEGKQAKAEQLYKADYASSLYNTFMDKYLEGWAQLHPEKAKELGIQVRAAANDAREELKDKGVTEINNVVSTKVSGDELEGMPLDKGKYKQMAELLKALGLEVMIGVDGALVTQANDKALFVDNRLMENGDIQTIIQALGYAHIEKSVIDYLSSDLRELIVKDYNKLTGLNGTINDAVKALLFDKRFYTRMLLLVEERGKSQTAIQTKIDLLSSIDTAIKKGAAANIMSGKLGKGVYNTLMEKVHKTMQAGLISYCTQYARLDLDSIPNNILPKEAKEIIKNNSNVKFSETLDNYIADKKDEAPSDETASEIERYIDKFKTYLPAETISQLKKSVRSTKYNDRVDAFATLTFLSKYVAKDETKVVYLPKNPDGILEQEYLQAAENYLGISWQTALSGDFEIYDLSTEAQAYFRGRYDMRMDTSRYAALADVLYNLISHKTLTVGGDGTILQVVDKFTFLKDRYLGENGEKNFRDDLRDGKINTVKDIISSKVKTSKSLLNKQIILDRKTLGSVPGGYDDQAGTILLNLNSSTDSVMHEITHAAQDITGAGRKDYLGGSLDYILKVSDNVLESIEDYLSINFPITYNYMLSRQVAGGTAGIIYFMLDGELKANASVPTIMSDFGFTWRGDRNRLMPPDGKGDGWAMSSSKAKEKLLTLTQFRQRRAERAEQLTIADLEQARKKPEVSEDRPLFEQEEKALAKDKSVQEFMKNSVLKKSDGTPYIFYRGSKRGDAELSSRNYDGIFLSSKPFIASIYSLGKKSVFRGYIGNFSKNEIFVVDGKGSPWSEIKLNDTQLKYLNIDFNDTDKLKQLDEAISTKQNENVVHFDTNDKSMTANAILYQIQQEHPEIKAVWIRNILETPLEDMPGDDLIVMNNATNRLKRITIDDKDAYVKEWREYHDMITEYLDIDDYDEEIFTKFQKRKLSSISEDRPLTVEEQSNLSNQPKVKEFIKDSVLKDKNGIPLVFYRGYKWNRNIEKLSDIKEIYEANRYSEFDSSKQGALFFTNKPYTAAYFAKLNNWFIPGSDNENLSKSNITGFIANIKPSEIITINAKNNYWNKLKLDNDTLKNIIGKTKETLTSYDNYYDTNAITNFIIRNRPDIKAVLIKNVKEGDLEAKLADYEIIGEKPEAELTSGDDLIIFDKSRIMPVTKFDGGKLLLDFEKWYDKVPEIKEFTHLEQYFNKFISLDEDLFNKEQFEQLSLLNKEEKKSARTTHRGSGVFANLGVTEKSSEAAKQKALKQLEDQSAYFREYRTPVSRAWKSNLKYKIQANKSYIDVHPTVRDFVEATTKNIDQLNKPVRELIIPKDPSTELSKIDYKTISDYAGNAADMNKYTFQSIAKYVYRNEQLAQMTQKEMTDLEENILDYAAIAAPKITKLLNDNNIKISITTEMTYNELTELLSKVRELCKTNEDFNKEFSKAKFALSHKFKVDSKNIRRPIEAEAEADMLNIQFMLHYDGTLASLHEVNRIGSDLAFHNILFGYDEAEGGIPKSAGTSNWIEKQKKANIEEDEDYVLPSDIDIPVDRVDMLNVIEAYITDQMGKEIRKQIGTNRAAATSEVLLKFRQDLEQQVNNLNKLSDGELYAKYLEVQGVVMERKAQVDLVSDEQAEAAIKKRLAATPKTEAQIKKSKMYTIKNMLAGQSTTGRTVAQRTSKNSLAKKLDGSAVRFRRVTDELKKYVSLKNQQLIVDLDAINKLSNVELDKLTTEITKSINAIDTFLTETKSKETAKKLAIEKAEKAAKTIAPKPEVIEEEDTKKAKDKLERTGNKVFTTTIEHQTFNPFGTRKPTDFVTHLLNTAWNDTEMSKVQGVESNEEYAKANLETFVTFNKDAFLGADLAEIEAAVDYFIHTYLSTESEGYRKWEAIKLYFLETVLKETSPEGIYAGMNSNLKQALDRAVKNIVGAGGTNMAIHKNIIEAFNPQKSWWSADMEIGGVLVPSDLTSKFFKAIQVKKLEDVTATMNDVLEYVREQKGNKRSAARELNAYLGTAMLSSPVTALRNIASNTSLKYINKLSSKLGNWIWKGKQREGQLKLDSKLSISFNKTTGKAEFKGKVDEKIINFINENFIENKFYDTFVSNISKYNPSDIIAKKQDGSKAINKQGKPTAEAIYTQLILKSMYNQYYGENLFGQGKMGKAMNWWYHTVMKMMSDDNFVREASIRYFGKILAERDYDLSKGVTDNVMNDFASALGLALRDYMHSENMFNKFEKVVADKSEWAWFAYKRVFPFAAGGWNWFKEMIKLSPVGLLKSIWDLARIDTKITKAEASYILGKSDIAPELTEYILKRNLGSGIIGSIAWIAGMILAALGFISVDDDDYGVPKVRIGNMSVDVSSIFGTSPLLAGAALVSGWKNSNGEHWWEKFKDSLGADFDFYLSSMPLMDLIQMDMYSQNGFEKVHDYLGSIALTFIPNIINYASGVTYGGTAKKPHLWQRAIAKLPWGVTIAGKLGWMQREVDPYTGEMRTWKNEGKWDAISRVMPYFSYRAASQNEKKTTALGLNKKMLNGTYTINDKKFNVTGKDLQRVNEAYGTWNAEDLTKFYNNQLRVKVKVSENSYRTLSYNQMTVEQRKRAVQTIMSNNAELAKIMAWTQAGNKYYGSATTYNTLRNRGITKNVYQGTKGFVETK